MGVSCGLHWKIFWAVFLKVSRGRAETVVITLGKFLLREVAEGGIESTKVVPLISANVLLMRGKLGEILLTMSYTVRSFPSARAYSYAYKN